MALELLSPSGGLVYHYRALRYRNNLWLPFKKEATDWIRSWEPSYECLLWFGPSAAYFGDFHWLNRFKKIVCIELDPIAKYIFNQRAKNEGFDFSTKIKWSRKDYLGQCLQMSYTFEPLVTLLMQVKPSAILFSNLLGQLFLQYPRETEDERFEVWKRDLGKHLSGKSWAWASYHDRTSGLLRPKGTKADQIFESSLSNQEIINEFYPAGVVGENIELQDHATEGLFDGYGGLRRYLVWEIRPQQFHLIEAIRG